MTRHVVTVARLEVGVETSCELVVVGPFRSHERAEQRAETIRRLADTYDDAGLVVVVEPLLSGRTSAQRALDVLYGAEVPA